jgi:uncharacterized protein (TIGR01777 family)
MRIVISGSGGLVGRWLAPDLEANGHQIVRLVRGEIQPGTAGVARWNPMRGELDPGVLSGADAVINLNGRSIADSRWTARVKEDLRTSRIRSTETLARAIAGATAPPPLLISASAVGYYGDRGDEILDEGSSAGTGFLAELARDWEGAALAAASNRTRVVLLRLAMVVGRGGALERMLLPFKLGAGGPIGSGRQWWPWIAMEDVVGAVRFLLDHPAAEGPINLAAPHEVRCAILEPSAGSSTAKRAAATGSGPPGDGRDGRRAAARERAGAAGRPRAPRLHLPGSRARHRHPPRHRLGRGSRIWGLGSRSAAEWDRYLRHVIVPGGWAAPDPIL